LKLVVVFAGCHQADPQDRQQSLSYYCKLAKSWNMYWVF